MPALLRHSLNHLLIGLALLGGPVTAMGGIAEDLVILHLDAIGGRARVDELTTIRKEGFNQFGDRKIPIRIWGAVPNRIRIETRLDAETTLIQGYNGEEVWQVRVKGGVVRDEVMSEPEQRQFVDDAWLLGPLIDYQARGMELTYGGISVIGESRGFLIDVNRDDALWCQILVSDDSYQVTAKRQEQFIRGRKVPVLRQFRDFRPVAGVWLPHRVEMVQDEHLALVTVYESIVPNPELPDGIFEKPPTS